MIKRLTSKEIAVKIREELKAAGYRNKDVGVRTSSNSVSLDAKRAGICMDVLERAALLFRSVDYCPKTGETLMGGNTFICVNRFFC